MDRLRIYHIDDQFFEDHRGYAFFPFQGGRPMPRGIDPASLHIVKTEPGETRGNHQHPFAAEWLHICGARSEIRWEEGGEIRRQIIEGDSTMIYIPAGVGHLITNLDDHAMTIVAFREETSPEPHTRGLDRKL